MKREGEPKPLRTFFALPFLAAAGLCLWFVKRISPWDAYGFSSALWRHWMPYGSPYRGPCPGEMCFVATDTGEVEHSPDCEKHPGRDQTRSE